MSTDDSLLKAVAASNVSHASRKFAERLREGSDPWEVHLSLFPVVQLVLNPPFINPHLPKMYRIYRELVPYLRKEEIPALIELEVEEYTRRPKLERLPQAKPFRRRTSFDEIRSAISDQDWEKTTRLMVTYLYQEGATELARRLLLLGTGYLDQSLGHSISCTAFILLEMLEREDQDPWPVLTALANYFCEGGFSTELSLRDVPTGRRDKSFEQHLLKATSGRGIVNLHHTITFYAIERVRHLFSPEEHDFMTKACLDFMGDKEVDEVTLENQGEELFRDYKEFARGFAAMDTRPLVQSALKIIPTAPGRRELGRFLIKGLCDHYQGNYNPHYLTGLGSALWITNQYWNQPQLVANALFQYLDFYFTEMSSWGT